MNFILIVIGLILLVKCADMFVDGSSNIAKSLGIPSLIVGLTIVSFGTSAPEAAISINASLSGANSISIGNAVGSNICNVLLVLGFSALFGKLVTKRKVITRDFVCCIFAGIVLLIMASGSFDWITETGVISQTNGLLLLCFLMIYVYALLSDVLKNNKKDEKREKFKWTSILLILFGIAGIIFGGDLVVDNATKLASKFGVSDNVVALSLIAIGTSLPELVTSVVAVRKGETDLAIGNVVGSNIFNIFFVLGVASAISPVSFGIDTLFDIVFMLASSMIVYLLVLRSFDIGRKKGILFILLYIVYMVYIVLR